MASSKLDLWFKKGYSAHQAGRLEEAGELYRRILQKTPSDVEVLFLLGTACFQLQNYDEACKHLGKAVTIKPDFPEALNNLGMARRKRGEIEEAAELFRRAIALKPEYADALSNLGGVLQQAKKPDEAEPYLRRALHLNPILMDAYYGLGLVLKDADSYMEASQCFLRVLQIAPDSAEAYNELGTVYKVWGRLSEAITCFEHALSLKPNLYLAQNNLGTTLEEMGRFEEAEQAYERAVLLNPEGSLATRWNKALLYLTQGILDKGWEAYELRTDRRGTTRFPYTVWDGGALEGKTILIYGEQGLGDEILFASCIPDMLAKARHCVLECEPRLVTLFARSFPSATVVAAGTLQVNEGPNVPSFDVQSAIGSLPRYLRPTLDSFPKTEAYFVADPKRVEYWRSRLAALGRGLKVGICWRSGLVKGERHKYYSQLTQWGEIFKVAGVHFVNLQYDECADELRAAEQKFRIGITVFPEIDLRNEIDESAALTSAMDLVISAGTAVAEIAAALGIETWRVDNYIKPWPALGTNRMPWHPTLTWFCQPTPDDWDTPLTLAGKALKDKALGIQNQTEFIQLPYGTQIAVSDSLEDIHAYVLKEQLGWFDSEYEFVLRNAQALERIVDVGAGAGQYAVPIAKKITGGGLWAFTRTADETSLLMKSRERNRLEQYLRVSFADENFSLDAEMDKHSLEGIEFVRIAQDMCDLALVETGIRFFSLNSPLVMFGIRSGAEFDLAVAERLTALGYGLFRLVPGLGLLVPFGSTKELDAYALNLFACKPDRSETLERQGILIRQCRTFDDFPGIAQPYWQVYLRAMPYATDRVDVWVNAPSKLDGWEVYWMALNLFALAKTESLPGAQRYAHLQAAETIMRSLIQELATLPRLLSLSRILAELGKREAAVSLLNQIVLLFDSGDFCTFDEPCLALTEAFARISPGNGVAQWMTAMVLAQRESLRTLSTYFTGLESLPALQKIQVSGFGGDEVDRRISLINTRFATPSTA